MAISNAHIQTLENILSEYKKFQKESRELLGYGHTDKRYVVQKKQLIDERLKKLKNQWKEILANIDPAYTDMLKSKVPSAKTLDMIRQIEAQKNGDNSN